METSSNSIRRVQIKWLNVRWEKAIEAIFILIHHLAIHFYGVAHTHTNQPCCWWARSSLLDAHREGAKPTENEKQNKLPFSIGFIEMYDKCNHHQKSAQIVAVSRLSSPLDDNDCEEFMCTRLWWWCERLHSFAHGLKQPEAGTILSAVLRMHLIQPRKPAGVKVCIRKTKIIVPIASSGCHLFRHQSERLALLSGFPKARSVCKMPLFLKCCQKRHTHTHASKHRWPR